MGGLKFFIILLFFVTAHCQEDNSSKENKTVITPTDKICKICSCVDGVINCENRDITQFFSEADWLGIQDKNPKRVIMSLNKFPEVTPFPELPIITLDLSHGSIIKLQSASFKLLQKMTSLDLSHNNISSAKLNPEVFEGKYMAEKFEPLNSMRSLNLSYNALHSLNPDAFEHLPELDELRLRGNPFTVLDHSSVIAIVSLPYLKILDLSSCQLKDLPVAFLHTPRYLERLDLSDNLMEAVPATLGESTSLKFLSLSNNPILKISSDSSLYKAFPKIPSLEELWLCDMSLLRNISEHAMSGLEGLKVLRIQRNPALSYIDPTIMQRPDAVGETVLWPHLEEIYLDRNNISVIDNGLVGRWDLMKIIEIQENPYLCDCTNQWMVDSLAALIRRDNPRNISDIICHEPIEMRGKSIIHLEQLQRHMRCVDAYGNRPERDAAILIGTFIGMFITIPLVLGAMLMYRRGYFTSCGMGGPAAFSRTFYKRTGTGEIM